MAKAKKIFLWVVLIVVLVVAVSFSYFWYAGKQTRVKNNAARPTFPYSDYSLEELKQFPQHDPAENTAPTVQTPEETHRKFVDALKKEDFDEAVRCCFREEDQKDMKESLEQIKRDNLLSKMIIDIDVTLKKSYSDSTKAIYSYSTFKDGKNFGHRIEFIKNLQGVWLIESL